MPNLSGMTILLPNKYIDIWFYTYNNNIIDSMVIPRQQRQRSGVPAQGRKLVTKSVEYR